MFLQYLECTHCGRIEAPEGPPGACPGCGAPLVARYDLAAVGRTIDRDRPSETTGMWAWSGLLPLPDPERAVSLGEGNTPLLGLPRLAAELGLSGLWLKDEGQNPTGSFKARGMSAAVSMARHHGLRELAVPSAGNAGGALAAYGARAGLTVHVAMPIDVPRANRIEAEVCGARVTLLEGSIADCGRWIREQCARHGWFDLSTLREPYRVEGKKTMGLELARELGWELPDVLLYPTGGGTGLVGIWKAFEELAALGWLAEGHRRPRMVAVQAAGCAPIVEAFHAGCESARPPADPRTIAPGLRVPSPIGDRWMLSVLRASDGTAIAVDDAELVAGTRELARLEGLFVAPEAGALVAALRRLLADGWIERHERVVLLGTASGLKVLECF